MAGRRLWVLGGTSGIGETVYQRIWQRPAFEYAHKYGIEDFNATYKAPIRKLLDEGNRPTDVVFSVGINRLDWINKIKLEDFLEVYKTNVYSFLSLIRVLDEEGAGPVNIVAVTSDAAWRPMRTSAIYCGSKAALEMTVRVASREYAPKGWRINAVAPGKVEDTDMTRYVDRRVLQLREWSPESAENYERQSSPIGRKVTRDEVAEVIEAVLMGPAAQTGEIVAVNGGR